MPVLCLLAAVASASPAWIVGQSGTPVVDAAQVVVSRNGDLTTLTYAPRVTSPDTRLGMLIPVPSAPDVDDATAISFEFLDRYEEFTAPRVDRITCDDLVTREYLYTAPGCRTTPEPEAVVEPRDAVDVLRLEGDWLLGRYGFTLVDNDPDSELQTWSDWLDQELLTAPDPLPPQVAPRAEGDQLWLAVRVDVDTPPNGNWLIPLRFTYREPTLRLPVGVGEVNSPGVQELILYTLANVADGQGVIANLEPRSVATDCMVDAGAPAAWYEAELAALADDIVPVWVEEYAGTPTTCDPCTSEPLVDIEVADFGFEGPVSLATLTRLRMRYRSVLGEELIVRFTPNETVQATRFVENQRELEFAFPLCDAGFVAEPATCDDLTPPGFDGGGCNTSPGPWAPVLLLPLLLVRRRRTAVTAAAAALVLAPSLAEAQERGRLNALPSVELLGGVTAWSTPRVAPEGVERAGPWPTNPILGLDAIWSVRRWRAGTLGLRGSVSGFTGRSAPGRPDAPVSFGLWEPGLGLTMRHGSFSSQRVQPFARWGAGAHVSILDSSVWVPHAVISFHAHVGAGAYVGQGARRLALELRTAATPRTDAYEVSFHPNSGIPGWLFLPGSVTVSLHAGVAFP